MDKFKKLMTDWVERMHRYPNERKGQSLVNALYYVSVDAYDKFTSGDFDGPGEKQTDCFYDDLKIPNLLEALVKEWSNESN